MFGSRALGTFRPASDIDLALFGDDLTVSDLVKLHVALTEFNLPVELDLIAYEQLTNANLRRHIDEKGAELFRRRA